MTVGSSSLGPYRLERPLGRGAMGVVYLARDTALDRQVAVKVLPPHIGRDPRRVERFVREARLLARLNHPHVVQIYAAGARDGVAYMALELVEGGTLQERAGAGELGLRAACEVVRDVARGLAAAHALGVIHRDLKPENVLLTADGGVKLADFGLAVGRDGPRITGRGAYLGTPLYSSPEQARGEELTAASDIYSLGVVLYELVAGAPPHDAANPLELLAKVVEAAPPPLAARRPDAPPALAALVARLLDKDPGRRPSSAEVVRALDALLRESSLPTAGPPVLAATSAPAERLASTATDAAGVSVATPERGRRRALVLAGAAALGLAALGLVAVRALSPAPTQEQEAAAGPVLVLVWERRGGAADLDWLESAASDFVSASLQGLPQVDRGPAEPLLAAGETPADVARRLEAAAWVGGAIYVAGDRVGFSTEIRWRDGRVHRLEPALVARDDVLEALADLGRRVGEVLAAPPAMAVAAEQPALRQGVGDAPWPDGDQLRRPRDRPRAPEESGLVSAGAEESLAPVGNDGAAALKGGATARLRQLPTDHDAPGPFEAGRRVQEALATGDADALRAALELLTRGELGEGAAPVVALWRRQLEARLEASEPR